MIQCVLLGGSNSVLKYGLGSGLEQVFDVKRLGLGATSCMQNLYEIVKNKDLISEADIILTESNVNDSFHVNQMDMPVQQMLFQIDEYYRYISNLNKKIYVIILPINLHAPHIESVEIINQVNEQHRVNVRKYKLRMVDLTGVTTQFGKKDLDKLIPHPRHINEALLHQLGINISNHLAISPFVVNKTHCSGYEYSVVTADTFGEESQLFFKKNSVFSEVLIDTSRTTKIPSALNGKTIVAIAAWSDGYSMLKVENGFHKLIKPFSNLNTVSELIQPFTITEDSSIKSEVTGSPTEKTALVSRKKDEEILPAFLAGLLLRSGENLNKAFDEADIQNLSDLIPKYEPFIKSIDSFLQNQQL